MQNNKYIDKNQNYSQIFDEILELYKNLKHHPKKPSIYLYYEERLSWKEMWNKKPRFVEKFNHPQKGLTFDSPANRFSIYNDGKFIYPAYVIVFLLEMVAFTLVAFSLFLFSLFWVIGARDEALNYTLYSFRLYAPCIIGIFLFVEVIGIILGDDAIVKATKQIFSKKKSFYSLLRKIKFNKENKEELRNLMKDDEILWEIFQVKYGKNKIVFRNICPLYIFTYENRTIAYIRKRSCRVWFTTDFCISLVFDIFFVLTMSIPVLRETPVFFWASIVFLIYTNFVNLNWIYIFKYFFKKNQIRP